MKFLLVGHAGFYNRGCEAIIITTVDMIKKNFDKPSFIITSKDVKNDREHDIAKNVQIIPHYLAVKRFSLEWIIGQVSKLFSSDYKANCWKDIYSPIINVLENVDCVISVGGDNYTMDYGYPTYFFCLNRLIKEAGKKLVIWGASIGPFSENERIRDIVNNLSAVDLITVRESYTMQYLHKLGLKNNIKRVADPAFLLEPESICFRDIDIEETNPILGFNISPLLKRYHNELWEDKAIYNVISFLKAVIKKYGFTILLIPHVIGVKENQNDYLYMKNIYEKILDHKKVKLVSDIYNARQLKFIISKCKYFIGARTHSTIAALSSGVPTLSIGYSVKSKGINDDIFGNLDYVIASEDLSVGSLKERFDVLVNREAAIRACLKSKIPFLKKLATENLTYLNEVIFRN